MKIPTEAELIQMERRANLLANDEEDDWLGDQVAADVETLTNLIRELRPACQ
jgi:hypothetical protein